MYTTAAIEWDALSAQRESEVTYRSVTKCSYDVCSVIGLLFGFVRCNSFLVPDGIIELRYVINDKILSCFIELFLWLSDSSQTLPISAYQLHSIQSPDGAPAAFSADYSRFYANCLNELENYIQDYDSSTAIVYVRLVTNRKKWQMQF
jgi:hypothetical protein